MQTKKFVILGITLPKWAEQFSSFFVIGVVNTVMDLAILYTLSTLTGLEKGEGAAVLKAISFSIVSFFSFLANKKWTFKEKSKDIGNQAKKYSQFIVISIGGLIINTSIVGLVTKFIPPLFIPIIAFQFTPKLWLLCASLIATAVSLVWNFLGYKFIVFKK